MKTIKVFHYHEIPKNFTGIVENLIYSTNSNSNEWYVRRWFKEGFIHREDGPAVEYSNGDKQWAKEGLRHRINGPAVENVNGTKYWWIEDICYSIYKLQSLIKTSIYLGKENGNHNLDWLRFLTDKGIKEFPIVPGMEEDEEFKPLLDQVFKAPIT